MGDADVDVMVIGAGAADGVNGPGGVCDDHHGWTVIMVEPPSARTLNGAEVVFGLLATLAQAAARLPEQFVTKNPPKPHHQVPFPGCRGRR